MTRRSLASTQLRRARAYRTRTGGSTTVLAVLAGRIASSQRSTGIDATHAGRIYNSRKCPGTRYSQVETRILTRHYRTLVQSPLYFNGYVNSTEGHAQHMDFKHSCREVLPDVIQARGSCTFLLSQPISSLRPLAETSIRLNCQRRAPRLPPTSGSDNLFSAFAPHSRASV